MNLKEKLDYLKGTNEFKEWVKNHPSDYLVSVFLMSDHPLEVQFDFYDEKEDKITSFSLEGVKVTKVEGSDILKDNKDPLKKLELREWDLNKSLKFAESLLKDKGEEVYKSIVALQNSENGPIWNITFITKAFKVMNIKLSCDDNKVLSSDLRTIFDFRKK